MSTKLADFNNVAVKQVNNFFTRIEEKSRSSDKLTQPVIPKTKDFIKINKKNLSRVSKINMRKFGQKEDSEYVLDTPKTVQPKRYKTQRPKSNYTYNKRGKYAVEITSMGTQTHAKHKGSMLIESGYVYFKFIK